MIKALLFILFAVHLCSQTVPYTGPDDAAGDVAWKRVGYMNGNRVLLRFENDTEIGYFWDENASRWPNDWYGNRMIEEIALIICGRVYVTDDSIPVDDLSEARLLTQDFKLDTLFYCQSNSHQLQDENPENGVVWNLQPVPGYCNWYNDTPAMSDNPDSWPLDGWPSPRGGKMGHGQWWGRAGIAKNSADLETFFVVNDAQDLEYISSVAHIIDRHQSRDERERVPYEGPFYKPRPELFIGDKNPDVTTQKGEPWGGLGLRIAVRAYQWNNALARDMLFWEYAISNSSVYKLNELFGGFFVDTGIGAFDGHDDLGDFSKTLDMVYMWDSDQVGFAGNKTGMFGFGFLETPARSHDLIDNDADGLVDELRDNQAAALVGPKDGIDNLEKYLSYYNYTETELAVHWDADEDQDWRDGSDCNGNGRYDSWEDAGDDVGLDGIGPLEMNYPGPDDDGTECDHRPNMVMGVGCEPNFGFLDVSESDMMGLRMFEAYTVVSPAPPYYKYWINDWSMYQMFSSDTLLHYTGDARAVQFMCGTGQFALMPKEEQRLSMVCLHSSDPSESSWRTDIESRKAPNLFRQKKIAQIIYEQDYQLGWISDQHDPTEETVAAPSEFRLHPNYPNPFNGRTRISFSLRRWAEVEVTLFDLRGRRVETLLKETHAAGTYQINWDAGDIPSGVYVLRMTAGPYRESRKLTIIR